MVMLIHLQHSHCIFVIILFGPFARLFINLTMRIRALFTKSATTLGFVEQAFWRVPLFTEWVGASSFEVIFAWPSRHSTFLLGLRVLDAFLSFCCMKRIRRRIRLWTFPHAYSYRGGNYNCFFSHIARWFPIANNLQEFFVHAVLSLDSWPRRFFPFSVSGLKILNS